MKLVERAGSRVVEHRKYYIYLTSSETVPLYVWTTLGGRRRRIRMTPETLAVSWERENRGEWRLRWVQVMGRRVHKQCPNSYVFSTFYDGGMQVKPLEAWMVPLIPWLGEDTP